MATGWLTHAIGAGVAIGGEFVDTNNSPTEAIVKGAFWAAAETFIPGLGTVNMISNLAGAATSVYLDHERYGVGKITNYYRPGFGNYTDTQQAYTMRQRSATALQQTKMNARSVLGSEARTFHTNFY